MDELRNLELERLDAMWAAIWPQVENGLLVAVDRALRIMKRRAQLLGLDAEGKVSAFLTLPQTSTICDTLH